MCKWLGHLRRFEVPIRWPVPGAPKSIKSPYLFFFQLYSPGPGFQKGLLHAQSHQLYGCKPSFGQNRVEVYLLGC